MVWINLISGLIIVPLFSNQKGIQRLERMLISNDSHFPQTETATMFYSFWNFNITVVYLTSNQ